MYFIAIRTRRYTHTQTLNAVSAASRYVRTDKWVFRCVSERVWMLWTGVMATTRITHTDFNRLAAGWKMAKTFFGFMFSNQMIILSLDNQCTCTYLIVPYRFLCVSHSHARSIEPNRMYAGTKPINETPFVKFETVAVAVATALAHINNFPAHLQRFCLLAQVIRWCCRLPALAITGPLDSRELNNK